MRELVETSPIKALLAVLEAELHLQVPSQVKYHRQTQPRTCMVMPTHLRAYRQAGKHGWQVPRASALELYFQPACTHFQVLPV
eukprot:401813-Pelagomonas_calceolata.AAC.1